MGILNIITPCKAIYIMRETKKKRWHELIIVIYLTVYAHSIHLLIL